MNKTPYTVGPIDSLSLNADVTEAFSNYRPACSALAYQGVQPNDGVALSQEMLEGYEEQDELCGSFMAAWA